VHGALVRAVTTFPARKKSSVWVHTAICSGGESKMLKSNDMVLHYNFTIVYLSCDA
jgi:hypothetical protein